MALIAMAFPKKVHPMVDDDVCARTAHEMRDRKRVDNPCRSEQITSRHAACAVARRRRSPLVVEIVEAAKRID